MFGPLGIPELIVIFVVALLVFGPRQLPTIGKSIGRALAELRRASNDFKRTIEDEVAADDVREIKRDLQGIRPAWKPEEPAPSTPPPAVPSRPEPPAAEPPTGETP